MKLTKYEHACFTVEKNGQVLVVDPGNFATDFIAPAQVVAAVITHQHADHFDPERLAEIFDKNDEVLVLGPADVIDKVEIENKQVVSANQTFTIGPFDLTFFWRHTRLDPHKRATYKNIGVLINDLVYYPGDSLELPNTPVDTLAIAAAAPWMKLSEAMDFLLAVRPRLAFPTHDAVASTVGKQVADRMLGELAQAAGIEYQRLETSIEI